MYLSVIEHRDYCGLLETCWYYRFGHRQVENVGEDTLALAQSTRPGDPSGPTAL
jgi:hypothetical protein